MFLLLTKINKNELIINKSENKITHIRSQTKIKLNVILQLKTQLKHNKKDIACNEITKMVTKMKTENIKIKVNSRY